MVWATMAAVMVAMPLMRCMKFSATRSAVSTAHAGPRTLPKSVPFETRWPSREVQVTSRPADISSNTYAAAACTSGYGHADMWIGLGRCHR